MGDFDPVNWEQVEATIGQPAPEIVDVVEAYGAEVAGEHPYEAVKTIHDRLYEEDYERTISSGAEPFITAYLTEKRGYIDPDEWSNDEYNSVVARRPSQEVLRKMVWEDELTLWWIGMLVGVHYSLVTYWCYEYDIPLMERNYSEESLKKIRGHGLI